MKKKIVLFAAALVALCAVGCGGQGQGGTPTPTQGASENGKTEPYGYVMEYEGTTIWMDMEASAVLTALGDPDKYFEAASCAFEGLEKQYTYAGIEIDTYEVNGKDYVSSVYFRDDLVSTPEGVSLYMTKADMIKAYGENYTEEFGMLVYKKEGMTLSFILKNDEIISIVYSSTVLN